MTILLHKLPTAPAAPDPFRSFAAFIAAGHDPEIDHWPPAEVAEYAEFNRQHQGGGQR
jgi:hypothetical protein